MCCKVIFFTPLQLYYPAPPLSIVKSYIFAQIFKLLFTYLMNTSSQNQQLSQNITQFAQFSKFMLIFGQLYVILIMIKFTIKE